MLALQSAALLGSVVSAVANELGAVGRGSSSCSDALVCSGRFISFVACKDRFALANRVIASIFDFWA